MFDQFWDIWPRKVARKHAEKAFKTALKRTSLETILIGARAYAREREGKDPSFTSHAATWLNGDRWEDFNSSVKPSNSNATADQLKRDWINKGRYASWVQEGWVSLEVAAGRIMKEAARHAGYVIDPVIKSKPIDRENRLDQNMVGG